jgi:hypothetical protein
MKFLYNIIIIIIIITTTATIMIYTQLVGLIACGVCLSIFSSSAQDLFTPEIQVSFSAFACLHSAVYI